MNALQVSGKRKRAIARATIKPGKGVVKINNTPLEHYSTNPLAKTRIKEPLILAGKAAASYDIDVNVSGGGVTGQADAIRLAIGRALSEQQPSLKTTFLDYDRMLLVADVRRKESAKPNSAGQARSKKQKSYR